LAVSLYWCKLKVDTNKHEDLNLMFADHGKEDKKYPLREKITSNKLIGAAPHRQCFN
jgi:hypothetical protein